MKILIALFLFSINVFAKDLYLTVRRDFSTTEEPAVELIYKNKAPISIRLLKPNDMKAFIAGQIDLRRSWKEPKVVINTAKYLVRGFNQTKLDVNWVRNAANENLRNEVTEKFAKLSGGQFAPNHSDLTEGPPKLIQKPDQFKLVKEFTFYPADEEKNKNFDVPGFNWWFHDGSDGVFKTKFLNLPKLDPGFYVLQVVQGTLEGQVVVVVNDLIAIMQQIEERVLIRAADRSGLPVKNASVSVRNLNGKWVKEATTNSDGEVMVDGVSDRELVVVVEGEKRGTAIIDSEYFSTQAVYPDLYLYTDRPMYKPGNEVSFKGILRKPKSGFAELFGLSEAVEVQVKSTSDNQILAVEKMTVNEFGSFSGTFKLPDQIDGGLYRVEAKVLEGLHIGEFRIKDYVKPTLWAKIKTAKETLHAGDSLSFDLEVGRYSGGSPDSAKYKVELYRTRFTVPQFVEDAGQGESAGPQYGFDDTESVATNIPLLVLSQPYVELSGGQDQVQISVPTELPGAPNYDYSFLLKVTVMDGDGNVSQTSKSFLDMKSEHMVQAKISGVYIKSGEGSTLTAKAIYPSGASYGKVSGKITLKLEQYGKTFETIKEEDFTTDANGKYVIKLPSDKVGRLRATVTMTDRKGVANSTEAEALVIGDGKAEKIARVDDVEIYLRRSAWSPREESKALLLLPEGWGRNASNEGRLFVTVAGRDYYDHFTVPVKGNVAWINQQILSRFGTAVYLLVSFPHPVKGWTERKISYRILQEDKILKPKVTPEEAEVSPGTEQTLAFKVLDPAGKGIRAEVAVAVVDEAVLALQPEMRPRLMDFFYPMDRLNAMSFLSTHFQSYGYGEWLASAFRPGQKYLTTNKLNEVLKEKDTAYWNGHVITDSNGEASVTFRMPANLTKWKVIVSAIDKEGRFGETFGEFQSKKKIELSLVVPPFLRSGDEVIGRLLLSNIKEKATTIKTTYRLSSSEGIVTGDNAGGTVDLVPKKDVVQMISLRSAALEDTKIIPMELSIDSEKESAKFGYEMKVKPSTSRVPVYLDASGGQVNFELAGNEKLRELKFTVSSGLSATVSSSLNWLIQYPHGCIEQLVNSTLPNLAIAELYTSLKNVNMKSKTEAQEKKDFTPYSFYDRILKNFRVAQFRVKYEIVPPAPGIEIPEQFNNVLGKARSFGEAGVSRINGSMSPNGEFSWFDSMETMDRVMSMHVLMSLTLVTDASLIKAINLRKIYQNLRVTIPYTARTESIMLIYAASRLASWGDQTVESKAAAIPSIKLFGDQLIQNGSIVEMSYLLLAMKNYGITNDGGLDKVTQELMGRVKEELNSVLGSNEFNREKWFPSNYYSGQYYRHLGREASSVAMAAHAVAEWGGDSDELASKVGSYLVKKFNGMNFGSTYETAHTLLHSQWLLIREAQDFRQGKSVSIIANGKAMDEKDVKLTVLPLGVEALIQKGNFVTGRNTLEVKGPSSDYVIKASGFKDVPLSEVKPDNRGWDIRREYYRLDEATGKKTLLNLASERMKVGDLIYVRLSFHGYQEKRPWWSTQYLLVTDELPAGIITIEEDRSFEAAPFNLQLRQTRYATRSINADRIIWYIDMHDNKVSPGELGYVARVTNAGSFQTGIAKIEDFYDEGRFSNTDSHRLLVDSL